MGATKLPGGAIVRDELERPTLGSGPVYRAAAVPLPCEDCLHAPICRIRPRLAEEHFEELRSPDPAISLAITVTCAHHLSVPEPDRIVVPPPVAIDDAKRRLASQHRGGEANRTRIRGGKDAAEKARRAAEVLAAVERHDGDRAAAAAELGMKANALAMVLKFAGARAGAPDEVTA